MSAEARVRDGSRPATSTLPPVAVTRPTIALSSDVFPAPLRPINATISPDRTDHETSRTAGVVP